ncbi:MAG: TVP38/TMEM64 family protein [Paraclostridium sordellii]|uniref:TVP38/TMEM64 family membrane protein n=1 Tax=Paraclostridium sordellii TaxID=1505 RepID=A0A9P1P8K3_PARSO|nr:TVP38/TMEM64 family protein [Paeniclostridium sordellii]CEO32540.1 DedA family protein [[Clostridium] sordellii] [Paeniclostridium sordellii]CEQ11983.1 DedA family protein [[Clostridium] sordellii] [Paeniclostridium sordellii]
MNKSTKRNLIKVIIVIAVISLYFFIPSIKENVNQAVSILNNLDVDMLKKYILSFGMWAPTVSFILMIFQSVIAPIPAFIITFANAGLFGWINGAILSWTSSMVGATLCFYIARFLGRDVVIKLTSNEGLNKVDKFFGKYGNYAILIARLLPFISFDIVSYAAGLTSMKFSAFFIATGIGQLPATIIYSYIGGVLTGTTKTLVTGLLFIFALSAIIALLKSMKKDKKINKRNNIV